MSKRGQNEGSLYRHSDALWAAAITLDGGKRKTIYGKTRAAVAARLTAVLRARQQGIAIKTSERLTVASYLTTWLEGARATIRPNTHRRYGQLVRKYLVPRLGRIALAKLAPADCAALFSAMLEGGSAPRSVIAARAVLGRALHEAEVTGVVQRNVVRLTRPPRAPNGEMRTLSATEARALLAAAAGDRLRALYVIALATGARSGELLGLRWEDLDAAAGTLRIVRSLTRTAGGYEFAEPKTASSRRELPLGAVALDTLRRHRVVQAQERMTAGSRWLDHGLIFASCVGTPLDAGNVLRQSFQPLLRRAGLPRVRFHDLRHTAATRMLEAGTSPKVAAEMLGHASVTTTLATYSHAGPGMRREAAGVLDRALGAS